MGSLSIFKIIKNEKEFFGSEKNCGQLFEELFGVTYLPSTTFANWEVERWIRKKCAIALQKGDIGNLALWLGKLHAKVLAEPLIPEVTIRYINDTMGYGVFTDAPLKQWQFIGEYSGVVRRRKILFPNLNDYCFMYPREWPTFPTFWKAFTIDSEKEGNFTRFINHSDTPNLESVGIFYGGFMRIIFRAIRDIEIGEELAYDYGDLYWRNRHKSL